MSKIAARLKALRIMDEPDALVFAALAEIWSRTYAEAFSMRLVNMEDCAGAAVDRFIAKLEEGE